MRILTQILVALAALAFVLAVIAVLFVTPLMHVTAEGYSRACTNLALIAIALSICFKEK